MLSLLLKKDTQLLSELTKLSNSLHQSIINKEHVNKEQVIFMQIRHYFRFYKQALLLEEKIVEAQNSQNMVALNKLKRYVYLLGNKLESTAYKTSEKRSQDVSLEWIAQAFSIYKGKHSIFNTQLNAIRTKVVIESLINQQVETAEQLLQHAKKIHLHIQYMLENEVKKEQQEVVITQYIFWGLTLGAISMSVLIAWQFIHKKVVKQVLRIRKITLLLARGRTQITIKNTITMNLAIWSSANEMTRLCKTSIKSSNHRPPHTIK